MSVRHCRLAKPEDYRKRPLCRHTYYSTTLDLYKLPGSHLYRTKYNYLCRGRSRGRLKVSFDEGLIILLRRRTVEARRTRTRCGTKTRTGIGDGVGGRSLAGAAHRDYDCQPSNGRSATRTPSNAGTCLRCKPDINYLPRVVYNVHIAGFRCLKGWTTRFLRYCAEARIRDRKNLACFLILK